MNYWISLHMYVNFFSMYEHKVLWSCSKRVQFYLIEYRSSGFSLRIMSTCTISIQTWRIMYKHVLALRHWMETMAYMLLTVKW